MAIARKFMRERPHIARALHVILAAQRVHAHARTPDIAGHHRKVCNADHSGRALAMLGHAQPVIDRAIAAQSEQTRRSPHLFCRNAGQQLHSFGRVVGAAYELGVVLELVPIAAVADEGFVKQTFGHNHMRQRRHYGDVGAGGQREVMGCLDMRAVDHFGPARIDHDQLCPFAQALLQAACKDRMARGGVCANDDNDIGFFNRVKVLRPGRGAKRLPQPVTGGRMADARAGIRIIVHKYGAGQFLHQIGFFIGAARGRNHTDRVPSVGVDQPLHPVRGKAHRLIPRYFLPRIVDVLADHRVQDAVLVAGIAISEATLHAGVATVGLAVLVGDHPHQFIAAHLGLEGTSNAAIGAGSDDRTLGRADLDDRLFLQCRGRACLHASAARHAIRRQRGIGFRAKGHAAVKATAFDGQREGALHLFAGTHTARADDTLLRIIAEVRV
jgi:hypothetical protein